MHKIDCPQKSYFGEDALNVWIDEIYYVGAFQDNEAIRLDIVRHDLKDGLTWNYIREIKNKCGFAEYDGVEFYPREKDVINTGNVRHLYLFDTALPLIRRIENAK